MNILTFNEIYYEKESKHISSNSYNIDAYDIKLNNYFNASPYEAINSIYPNRFKEW